MNYDSQTISIECPPNDFQNVLDLSHQPIADNAVNIIYDSKSVIKSNSPSKPMSLSSISDAMSIDPSMEITTVVNDGLSLDIQNHSVFKDDLVNSIGSLILILTMSVLLSLLSDRVLTFSIFLIYRNKETLIKLEMIILIAAS